MAIQRIGLVKEPQSFAAYLTTWWGVLSIVGALIVLGWGAHTLFATKADASSLAPLADAQKTDHDLLIETHTKVEDVAKGLDGVREDMRALAQGHPLPAFSPVAAIPTPKGKP